MATLPTAQQDTANRKYTSAITACLTLAIIVVPFLFSLHSSYDKAAMLALFCSVVLLWFSELIPLAATALLIPCLAILYGISDSNTAFSSFGNQILFLFIGAFLIAKAMQKHGFDKRIAYQILALPGTCDSLPRLAGVIALVCWFLSMWISNTAACVIMVPVILGISSTLQNTFPDHKTLQPYTVRLLFTCAFAATIGGLATPVGTPPNVLAIEFLNKQGVSISFGQWMSIGLPVSIGMLIIMLVLLNRFFPAPSLALKGIRQQFQQSLQELGPMQTGEKQVALCFLLAISLWITPDLLKLFWPESSTLQIAQQRLPMGVVAILCASLLFVLPSQNGQQKNLDWRDAQTIDWGTIILFGGGLCLGTLLSKTGLANDIGQLLFATNDTLWLAGLCTIAAAIIFSEFSSNTASASIIIPIVIGAFADAGTSITSQLILATAFGASYGFMLPVSTPPNAIIYGTGKIPLRQMIKTGLVFDIAGFVFIALAIFLFLPFTGLL